MEIYNTKQRVASDGSFSTSYYQEKVQKGIASSKEQTAYTWIPCQIDYPEQVFLTARQNMKLVRANVLIAGSTTDDFGLDAGASDSDDYYNGMIIKIQGKPSKIISDYDATGGTIENMVTTTETDLDAAPAAGTPYEIWDISDTPNGLAAVPAVRMILDPVEALDAHAASAVYNPGVLVKASYDSGDTKAYVCIEAHTSTAGPDFDTDYDAGYWQEIGDDDTEGLAGFLKVVHADPGANDSVCFSYEIRGRDKQ